MADTKVPLLLLLGLVAAVLVWLARQRQKRQQQQQQAAVFPASAAVGDSKSAKKSAEEAPPPGPWPPLIRPADFDWESSDPRPFRPFKPVYHITMALQSTSPEDLIVLDRNYRDRIELRRAVIAANPKTVMGIVPSSESPLEPSPKAKAAVDELYAYLMGTYLPARYPAVFVVQRRQQNDEGVGSGASGAASSSPSSYLHNRVTGATFPCAPPADPLEAFRILGETVEDDFFLLQEEDGPLPSEQVEPIPAAYPPTSHRATAFLCCFPSGFDPSAKLGHLLRDIHAPVPAYDKIGPSMERFFSRQQSGKNVKRLNWSIQTHGNLFSPKSNHIVDGDVFTEDEEVDMTKARMRVECQTVTRLPQTGVVLFSFKTYLFPVCDIKAEGLGPSLADAIQGLKHGNAPGMWVYKGAVRWGNSVCEYLRS